MENKNGLEASEDATQNTENTGIENNTPVLNEATTEPQLSDLASVVDSIKASTPEVIPRRNIPLAQPVDTAMVMSFEEALILDFIEEGAIYDVVDSKGRAGRSFEAIEDKKREVKTYEAADGNFFVLPLSVQGGGKSEGGSIGAYAIEKHTKFRFPSANHKDQVTVVLSNGKHLIGYVYKGFTKDGKVSKRTFYFPRNLAEKVIKVPEHRKVLELRVKKILVG